MTTEADARQKQRNALLAIFQDALSRGPNEGTTNRFTVRCAPGQIRMTLPLLLDAPSIFRAATDDDSDVSDRIKTLVSGSEIEEGNEVVHGTASSTSVDWYGTEMDVDALVDMEAQFIAGVSLFPRHGGFLDQVHWSDEFGRTIAATIRRADVAEPFDESEPGWVLDMAAELFTSLEGRDGDTARTLVQRLTMKRPQPIGLSIGGWFLEMTLIRDEETGDPVRIIIHKVELDHLAVVRSPANPDSHGLQLMRDIIREAMSTMPINTREADASAPSGPVEVRETVNVNEAEVIAADDTATEAREIKPSAASDHAPSEETSGEIEPRESESDLDTAEDTTYDTGITQEVTEHRALDAATAAGQTTSEPGDQRTADEGESMDPEIKALLEGIAAGQRDLGERLSTLEERAKTPEPTPAPVPEPAPARAAAPVEDPTIKQMRAELEALKAARANQDAVIADLVSGPSGRAAFFKNEAGADVPIPDGVDSVGPFIRAKVAACEAKDEAQAVRAVIQRYSLPVGGQDRSVFDLSWKARGDKPGTAGGAFREACGQAEDILRTLCRAAGADGTAKAWMRAHQLG